MNSRLKRKLSKLQDIMRAMDGVVVAYSGGVDSSLLLKVARGVLGKNVVAVTASSQTYSSQEMKRARAFARKIKVSHLVIQTHELKNRRFSSNPHNRCFFCKQELFSKLRKLSRKLRLPQVIDGANLDDVRDYRPGSLAARRYGVRSPLQEAHLTKDDIRALSKQFKLSTWDAPSAACLASRFPYGHTITGKALRHIAAAEDFLRRLGFQQVRVRHYGTLARIEVLSDELPKLLRVPRRKIINKLKELGYNYVTVDLEGYRTGSMNEILSRKVLA